MAKDMLEIARDMTIEEIDARVKALLQRVADDCDVRVGKVERLDTTTLGCVATELGALAFAAIEKHPSQGPRSLRTVSSVFVDRAGGHEVVRVWNRGGLAGELTVQEGDGKSIAAILLGAPADAL